MRDPCHDPASASPTFFSFGFKLPPASHHQPPASGSMHHAAVHAACSQLQLPPARCRLSWPAVRSSARHQAGMIAKTTAFIDMFNDDDDCSPSTAPSPPSLLPTPHASPAPPPSTLLHPPPSTLLKQTRKTRNSKRTRKTVLCASIKGERQQQNYYTQSPVPSTRDKCS